MLYNFAPILEASNINPAFNILSEGIYSFKVTNIELVKAKSSGNEQFKIDFDVMDGNIPLKPLTDYIPLSLGWKLRDYCKSVNREDDAKNGQLDSNNHIGLQGKFKVGIRKGTPKDPNNLDHGNYPDKNDVKKYLPFNISDKSANATTADFNDPIPW